VFVIEWDLVSENLEVFFSRLHVIYVRINQFIKIVLRALIWNKQEASSGCLTDLRRQYDGNVPVRLLEFTAP
jgi:hypothetical protein